MAVRQTSPLSRTYVEQAWVHLQPGEERDVHVHDRVDARRAGARSRGSTEHGRSYAYEVPNSLRLTGIADDHEIAATAT